MVIGLNVVQYIQMNDNFRLIRYYTKCQSIGIKKNINKGEKSRAYNFALNKIRKQTNASYRKARQGAKDYNGKPIPAETQIWHLGRVAGLKTAKQAFFSGKKAGFTQGRKQGFRSGKYYGSMSRGRRYSY